MALIPSADLKTMKDIIVNESELIGGPVVFLAVGLAFFRNYEKKKISNT